MENKLGLYKFNQILLMGFLLFGGLYLAQSFLIPVFIAALLAMLLLPVCKILETYGWSRVFAITTSVFFLLAILTGIIYMFSYQIGGLLKDFPLFRSKIQQGFLAAKNFVTENTKLSPEELNIYMETNTEKIFESLGSYLQNALTLTTDILVNFFIVLIYIGFFLYYRGRIEKFILKLAPHEEKNKTNKIIKSCTNMAVAYLAGILTVSFILSVCNYIALSIFGIQHALLFAVLAGILNIIPFVGTFLGSIFPIALALLTKDTIWVAVGVAIYFSIIQYIESYFLTPIIVGGKVRVNPLTEILALVLGGVVWGVPGMILFIPLTGLIKVLFDHIDKFEPYAYVIGRDGIPKTTKFTQRIKNLFKNKISR
ncbi:MAG: AI-2E family transporter [Bacteroidota bacterium]|nr:AI-2E family transporter [Bacteroidota bacterium]